MTFWGFFFCEALHFHIFDESFNFDAGQTVASKNYFWQKLKFILLEKNHQS